MPYVARCDTHTTYLHLRSAGHAKATQRLCAMHACVHAQAATMILLLLGMGSTAGVLFGGIAGQVLYTWYVCGEDLCAYMARFKCLHVHER